MVTYLYHVFSFLPFLCSQWEDQTLAPVRELLVGRRVQISEPWVAV